MAEPFCIAFVGDVMLGRLVNQHLKSAPPSYPWGDTLSVLKKADLRICNLECAVSDSGDPWHYTPKVFHFRTDAKNVEVLKATGINIVSLANNHVLDFGYRALADTTKILDQAGILHAGAGSKLADAARPAIFKSERLKIAMLAVTDNEPAWKASDKKPGIYFCPIELKDPMAKELMGGIKDLKKKVDLVILSLHWGPNWGYEPLPEHRLFARALIDAGADIVYGHSAHIFRGVEIYKGKPIMYSTGDFIDDYAVDDIERNDESFIFGVELKNGRLRRLALYPTVIDYFQAKLAGGRSRAIAARMATLCAQLGTSSNWNVKAQTLEISLLHQKR